VAYLTDETVNAWLAHTKYTIEVVEPELETAVVAGGFGKLSLRYATTGWTDEASTPPLVITALSMLYAAWYLQRQISDDEMDAMSYPIRLEARAWAMLDAIATGLIDLPGVDPDPTLTDNRGPLFFPDDASTQLSIDDPFDPEGSPRAFAMNQVF